MDSKNLPIDTEVKKSIASQSFLYSPERHIIIKISYLLFVINIKTWIEIFILTLFILVPLLIKTVTNVQGAACCMLKIEI